MFRPCIDLHEGRVKQIVGGTLEASSSGLKTNFVSEKPASWFASLYKRDKLDGGHVIMLGPGNEAQARDALHAFPEGLQIGGGINKDNASDWLGAGASHVIVTSWVFRGGQVDWDRLAELSKTIGREKLVIDLSCRVRDGEYFVVADRWQKFTSVTVTRGALEKFAQYCSEFLVHAVDVEGLCRGVDERLVRLLGEASPLPVTYAGGAASITDLDKVNELGCARVDLTIGSALDIFGGGGVKYADAVGWNRKHGGS
jgi:phosphoribosylformimino-5-aminoimidazole carboxamide ribotide isomerase